MSTTPMLSGRALCALLLVAVAVADPLFHLQGDDDGRDDRSVDFSEQSGQIKLCDGASCSAPGRRQIQFRLSRLVEIGANNVPVPDRYVDLEQVNFVMHPGPPQAVPDADGNPFTPNVFQMVRNVTLHGADPNTATQITVNVTGLIAPRAVRLLMYGGVGSNLTVDLPERALKLYFQIAHWPFQSAQNRLLFVAKIRCRSRKGDDKRPPQVDGADRPRPTTNAQTGMRRDRRPAPEKRFRLGDDDADGQYLDAPAAVVVDGQVIDDAVQLRLDPSDQEMAYAWLFPSFHDTLVYDPTLGMASISSSGAAPTSAAAPPKAAPWAGVAFALALAFLLV